MERTAPRAPFVAEHNAQTLNFRAVIRFEALLDIFVGYFDHALGEFAQRDARPDDRALVILFGRIVFRKFGAEILFNIGRAVLERERRFRGVNPDVGRDVLIRYGKPDLFAFLTDERD